MYIGKEICKTLKEIRQKVARANDIPFKTTECKHQGDCAGTCPKCEEEVRYIEQQLDIRRALGKAVTIIGVGVGITALSSCNFHKGPEEPIILEGDVPYEAPTQVDTFTEEDTSTQTVKIESDNQASEPQPRTVESDTTKEYSIPTTFKSK